MDYDKLIAIFKAVGFPTAVAIWFLFKIQIFFDTLISQQATLIELLRQLIVMHQK